MKMRSGLAPFEFGAVVTTLQALRRERGHGEGTGNSLFPSRVERKSGARRWLGPLLAATLLAPPSLAGKTDAAKDYIFGSNIEAGVFVPSISTTVRLDSTSGEEGTEVSLEGDLGYSDQKTLPLFQATWRISKNWLVQLDYVNLDRSSSKTLEGEIEWPPDEGEYFPIGAEVSSFFDFESARVAGAYIFKSGKRGELALVFGLHVTSAGVGIDLTADIAGETGSVGEDASVTAFPLPSIGLHWGTRFGENWSVRLRGDFFYLKYDAYSGGLLSARADLSYHLSRNWAIGAGLNYYHIYAKAQSSNFTGKFDFRYWGPNAFVRYIF